MVAACRATRSQTNPHIVPLVNFKSLFAPKWAHIMEAELKHRCDAAAPLLPPL